MLAELEITNVRNDGDADKECVRLIAKTAGRTRGYALVDSTFRPTGEPSNEFRHIFIFPSIKLEVGDVIRVYTGEGEYKSNVNTMKTTTHRLYWNSKGAVWNDKEGDEAVLIKFEVVNRMTVPPKRK